MEKIGFVVKGKTFLKCIFPLILASNKMDIRPQIICYKKRIRKEYDNLDFDYLKEMLSVFKVEYDLKIVDNDDQALETIRSNKIHSVIVQDASHQFSYLCRCENLQVFSIGVFFDTLHYSNELKSGVKSVKQTGAPDVVYFHSELYKSEFIKNYQQYPSEMKVFENPYFDQLSFLDKNENAKIISFFPGNQSVVEKSVQTELELALKRFMSEGWTVVVKQRSKDPWFHQSNFYDPERMIVVSEEIGFPSTALSIINQSKLVISCYSTATVEGESCNVSAINLDINASENDQKWQSHIYLKNNFREVYDSKNCTTYKPSNGKTLYDLMIEKSEINLKGQNKNPGPFWRSELILSDVMNHIKNN